MRLKYKKLIIFFTLAIMLIGMGSFSLVAPNVNFAFGRNSGGDSSLKGNLLSDKSEEDIKSEITTLVKDYFDAKQRVDMEALAECVSDVAYVEEKRLVTEAEYIEEYKNIECTILNDGLQDGTFRVYVYYEAKVYDIDTLVPSLTALYVTADKNGKFTIYLSVIDSDDQKAIDRLDNSDKVKKMITSVQKNLESIVSKNADVRDFYQMLENTGSDDDTEDNTNIHNEGTSVTPAPSAGTGTSAPGNGAVTPVPGGSVVTPVPGGTAVTPIPGSSTAPNTQGSVTPAPVN
ncbi:MAG: hypothetical protein HFH62_14165 [Lachnospiraceae bacterium]|nr:hypothetical protein [Lachnospiraceae bacterium]